MTDAIQQQLIDARRNQILDAAAAVFAEKGFHPTTIRDIAKYAGIADGTIYNYFDSKPALLFAIFERMRAAIVQDSLPPIPEDVDLRTFVGMFLYHPLMALQHDNFALFRIVTSEMMVNDEVRALYSEKILMPTLTLAEGFLAAHAAKFGLSPERVPLVIRAISGMVMGLLMQRIVGDPVLAEQWDSLPETLTDLIVKGLQNS